MRFSGFSRESLLAIPDTPALGGEVALENFPEPFSRFVEAVLYRPLGASLPFRDFPYREQGHIVHEKPPHLNWGECCDRASQRLRFVSPRQHLLRVRRRVRQHLGSIASKLRVWRASCRSMRHHSRWRSSRASATSRPTATATLPPPEIIISTHSPSSDESTQFVLYRRMVSPSAERGKRESPSCHYGQKRPFRGRR